MSPMHRQWCDTGLAGLDVPMGGNIVPLDLCLDMDAAFVNKTVTRVIVGLQVHHDNHTSDHDAVQELEIGIGVVSEEAFLAGQASMPKPDITTEFPARGWLWVASYTAAFSNSTTFGVEIYDFPRIDVDLRASRKVDRGILFLAAESRTVFGAGMILNLTGRIRALMLTG